MPKVRGLAPLHHSAAAAGRPDADVADQHLGSFKIKYQECHPAGVPGLHLGLKVRGQRDGRPGDKSHFLAEVT